MSKDLWDDSNEENVKHSPLVPLREEEKPKESKIENARPMLELQLAGNKFNDYHKIELEKELKPEFSYPKFGPFKFVPIELKCPGGAESNFIPLSIARYLPPCLSTKWHPISTCGN